MFGLSVRLCFRCDSQRTILFLRCTTYLSTAKKGNGVTCRNPIRTLANFVQRDFMEIKRELDIGTVQDGIGALELGTLEVGTMVEFRAKLVD